MMIHAGGGRGFPLDYGELERWTRVGTSGGWQCGAGNVEVATSVE
jgi:hypothetical protein